MSNPVCIADSDFLIAQIMKSDVNHEKALKVSKDLLKRGASVLYPSIAIIEAATAIQRKYNNPALSQALLEAYKDPDLQVIPVDQETVIKVASNFSSKTSKHNTPFDFAILVLAKDRKADIILSFDSFYKNKGFKTAASI